VSVDIESARRDWEDGYRRFISSSRDPAQADRLHSQVDVVTEELRRRVGGTYTLAGLVLAYATSEKWIRQAVEERAATAGWARSLAVVGDAAFHIYARGAMDYRP